ncbi:MAG: hypothetical protein ACON5H_09895 [Akkermansiaceae bacterium]
MNAFAILEVPERLVISPQELERRFDVRGKSCHPDAGGSAEEFSRIRGAYDVLKTPSGRIRAALESLSGSKGAPSSGEIPSLVMSSFSSVANVLEEVEEVLGERRTARSGLKRAMADAKIPLLKRRLEWVLNEVVEVEDNLVAQFGRFDEVGWSHSVSEMAEVFRGLRFIEKWKGQLQAATGKLFEALLGGAG